MAWKKENNLSNSTHHSLIRQPKLKEKKKRITEIKLAFNRYLTDFWLIAEFNLLSIFFFFWFFVFLWFKKHLTRDIFYKILVISPIILCVWTFDVWWISYDVIFLLLKLWYVQGAVFFSDKVNRIISDNFPIRPYVWIWPIDIKYLKCMIEAYSWIFPQ